MNFGSLGLDMANGMTTYDVLKNKYQNFSYPQAEILINNEKFTVKKEFMVIDELNIELSCGFESAIASFKIFNVYDHKEGKFKYDQIKKKISLGSCVEIKLGYSGTLETVFVGFIAEIAFGYEESAMPFIEVSCMDIKGIMMANTYSYQLKANNYGDAVKEILEKAAYVTLRNQEAIRDVEITATPDKKQGSQSEVTSVSMEMVSESDYEFVVKAAKKFNYEFFTSKGKVLFRKAKTNAKVITEIGVSKGITNFLVRYNMTGLIQEVETRSFDSGQGKLIKSKEKHNAAILNKSTVGKIIKGSRQVYVDPTITTQEDADARAKYLMENISYSLGKLDCEAIGLPEILPGNFINISGLGSPADNSFYLTSVIHTFSNDRGYRINLIGKAAEVK